MISKASISIDSNAELRNLLPQNSFRSFCLPPNNTKTSSSVCILIVSSITHIFCISLFIQYFLLSTCNFLTSSHTHINYTLLAHLTHHIFMCYSNQHLSHNIAQSCLSFHLISHSKFFFSSFHYTINIPLHFSFLFIHFIFLFFLFTITYDIPFCHFAKHISFHFSFVDISYTFISYHIHIHSHFQSHAFHSHFISLHNQYSIAFFISFHAFHFSFSFSFTITSLISYHTHIHSHFSITCMLVHIHSISFQYSCLFQWETFCVMLTNQVPVQQNHATIFICSYSFLEHLSSQLLVSIHTQELQSKNFTLLYNSCLLRTKEGFYH